jgi:hypothetical protein
VLADAIDFPLVAVFGLAIFGPLTLLVTLIECLVFKVVLRMRIRIAFKRVLVANIISTLAGGLVFGFQDALIHSSGITSSIPAFVHGYYGVGLLLVLVYYTKSAVVEGLLVATRRFALRVERSRLSLVKAVVIGNLASYLVVGPLFIFSTRPTFGNVDVVTATRWTANPAQTVFFIGAQDHFIKRVVVSGDGLQTVVPHPAVAFLVSADESAFVYRGTDGNLYAYRTADAAPTLVWTTQEHFLMHSVSLSPDKQRVAYADGREHRLSVFDLASRQTSPVSALHSTAFDSPVISWSRDGALLYALQDSKSVSVFRGAPPYAQVASKSPAPVPADALVENYVRSSRRTYGSRDDWGCVLDDDSKGAVTNGMKLSHSCT